MPAATVAPNVLQALDVHADRTSQVTLYHILIHFLTQAGQLLLREILGSFVLKTLISAPGK